MTTTPLRLASGRYMQELRLLEQVHAALGSASRLDDFYVIAASLLVDVNTFGFSHAFILPYDERTRTLSGRLALGASSPEEHERFRHELHEEDLRLQEQVEEIRQHSKEPHALQDLYDLRYHSLWIQLLQGEGEGAGLNTAFQSVQLSRDVLTDDHILEMACNSAQAQVFAPGKARIDGLERFIKLPAVAGRLMTKRGLHGILIADKQFEPGALEEDSLIHFQWLLNHASVTLDNVELVADLRATTQRLQDVDRLKTSFLSIVSHELRTPLTSIVGFVHLLSEEKVGSVNPAQLDLLKRVSQHSNHLQSMVNDLLEIAEVEAGGMINVAIHPVDPLAALLRVQPKVEARRASKQVTIEPVIREKVPMLMGDEQALERILFHLLDNAIKFIHGPGRITVEFTRDGAMLNITVADTGIGISQDNLKRIFDHFYQVDFRLERAYGGMGIGLTVVKLLLEATGGKIYVESAPGMGSRFTVSFPIAG